MVVDVSGKQAFRRPKASYVRRVGRRRVDFDLNLAGGLVDGDRVDFCFAHAGRGARGDGEGVLNAYIAAKR